MCATPGIIIIIMVRNTDRFHVSIFIFGDRGALPWPCESAVYTRYTKFKMIICLFICIRIRWNNTSDRNTIFLIAVHFFEGGWSLPLACLKRQCNFLSFGQIFIAERKFLVLNLRGNWPRIYIIVKQLSNANPTMKRHNVNVTKLFENAVRMPPTKPNRFEPTSAGMRPYRSAIHPKSSPPTMAPQKNTDWAIDGRAALSHTHSNWNRTEVNF